VKNNVNALIQHAWDTQQNSVPVTSEAEPLASGLKVPGKQGQTLYPQSPKWQGSWGKIESDMNLQPLHGLQGGG